MKEMFDAVWSNGALRPLRKFTAREGQRVRVFVEPETDDGDRPPRAYDLSDLVGRLTWSGDPLAEQRRLRDEWL